MHTKNRNFLKLVTVMSFASLAGETGFDREFFLISRNHESRDTI